MNKLVESLTHYSKQLQDAKMPAPLWLIHTLLARHGKIYGWQKLPKRYKPMTPKHCFGNAYRMLHNNLHLDYCEGFIFLDGITILPIHHAWLINQDNKVIDPTLRNGERFEYIGITLQRTTVYTYFCNGGYGVFNTMTGPNYEFIFEFDPTLQDLIDKPLIEQLIKHSRRQREKCG